MKKILTFAFALLLMFSLISCKKETPDQGGNEQNQQTQQTQENVEDTGFKVETSQKVYLTTIGQSDFDTVANLIDKTARKDVVKNNLLKAADVEDGSVVILVVGSSTKGLGSAGTDINEENVRAEAFAKAAKENKFSIVLVHVGGEQRRGAQADPIIRTVVPAAKLVMVVKTGNADGLFNTLAGNTIPCYSYTKATQMVKPFQAMLG